MNIHSGSALSGVRLPAEVGKSTVRRALNRTFATKSAKTFSAQKDSGLASYHIGDRPAVAPITLGIGFDRAP